MGPLIQFEKQEIIMDAKENEVYITSLKAEAKEQRRGIILYGVLTVVLLICTLIFWEELGNYVYGLRFIDLPILGGRLFAVVLTAISAYRIISPYKKYKAAQELIKAATNTSI